MENKKVEQIKEEPIDKNKKGLLLTKSETMFTVGPDGKVMPEEIEFGLYDKGIDIELAQSVILLDNFLRRFKSMKTTFTEFDNAESKKLNTLKLEMDKADEKTKQVKTDLYAKTKVDYENLVKNNTIQLKFVYESINEVRSKIKNLEKIKIDKVTIRKIEAIPCTVGESYSVFDKNLTIEGKKTDDWMADLISKKVTNPKYTLDEAKKLLPSYKICMKDAIGEISYYTLPDHIDRLEELRRGELVKKVDGWMQEMQK